MEYLWKCRCGAYFYWPKKVKVIDSYLVGWCLVVTDGEHYFCCDRKFHNAWVIKKEDFLVIGRKF